MPRQMRFFLILLLIPLSPSFTCGDVLLGCHDEGFQVSAIGLSPSEKAKAKRVPLAKNITSPLAVTLNGLSSKSVHTIATWCAVHNLRNDIDSIQLVIDGEIRDGDARMVADILQAITENESVYNDLLSITVYLNSTGGNATEAMKIGRLFATKKRLLNTWVEPESVCASACVLLLAGGNRKFVHGKLAIHRIQFTDHAAAAGLKEDQYRMIYDKAMDEMKSYLKEMGVRVELAEEMMRYSSDDAHVLTKQEVSHYGLNQQNPYIYEHDKAWWIARCGKEWWELKQTLEKTAEDRCDPRNFVKVENGKNIIDGDEILKCYGEIIDPLYKMCGVELPKNE